MRHLVLPHVTVQLLHYVNIFYTVSIITHHVFYTVIGALHLYSCFPVFALHVFV